MTFDPDDPFFQEDDSQSHDDDLKNTKDSQLHKDTMKLIKQKMCPAQDLFDEINRKEKENNDLRSKMQELKVDKEKLYNKLNSESEKSTRLELSKREYEKSLDDYKYTDEKQKLQLDEKRKHIEQLEFKIKEMEKDSFHLKDEIKKLQQENKISKSIAKKATKNQGSQTMRAHKDVSTTTDFNKSPGKLQIKDKSTMTDRERMPYPVFCSKCDKHIDIPPLTEILRIMTSPLPPTITNQFSPPSSPRSVPSVLHHSESIPSNTFEQHFNENPCSSKFDTKKSTKINEETDRPSFMLIDNLSRKINKLERQIKKKQKQKQDNSCHKTCCSSKNIKFVVKLPNEGKYIEYAKHNKHNQKGLKRLQNKQFKLKNKKTLKLREWQVENDVGTENINSSLEHSTDQTEKKYKNPLHKNETVLSNSPVVPASSSNLKNQDSIDLSLSETMHTHTEMLSTLDVKADGSKENLSDVDMVSDDKNVNECNSQASISNPVLESYENASKQSDKQVDCASAKVFQVTNSDCNLSLDVSEKVNSNEPLEVSNKNISNSSLFTIQSEKGDTVDTKNENTDCLGFEIEGSNDEAVISQVQAKLECPEICKEAESTLSNIRRLSISSTSSMESDDLFSAPPVCVPSINSSQLDVSKHENEQISISDTDCTDNAIISKTSDEINSEEIHETVDENEQSADDSVKFKCPSLKRKKQVMETDDTDEESNENKYRKTLIARKKRIISKINQLKKNSTYPVTPKPTVKVIESKIDTTDIFIPTKKQRIAHVPKDNSEVQQISFLSKDQKNPLQKVESGNALVKTEPASKKIKVTEKSPQKAKNPILTRQRLSRQSTSSIPESKPILTGIDPLKLADEVEDRQVKEETIFEENEKNKQDDNSPKEKEIGEIADENLELNLLASQNSSVKTEKSREDLLRIPVHVVPDYISTGLKEIEKKESVSDLQEDSYGNEPKVPVRNLRVRKVIPKTPERRISKRLQEPSPSAVKSDAGTNDSAAETVTTPTPIKKNQKNKKTNAKKNLSKLPFIQAFDSSNSSLADTVMMTHLKNYLQRANEKKEEMNFEQLENNEQNIREQLALVIETEPLTIEVLTQVSENLLNITPLELVALVLVEFASTEYLDDVKCNTTYTPPAPPMTKFEQKLVTLISTIKEKSPEFLKSIEKGLEYKLFRIGKAQEVHIVERLFRILVVLNKIKKDREKVRMLFCDALYCFNTRAMNIIYIALSCWSEVFPKHDANNDILVKTIVHIIMSSNVNRPFSKLMPLKRLLTDYYGYPNSGFRVENFKQELMENLKENISGVNTAIILLCKSKGAEWTLENVVKHLKQMIVSQVHPSMYDALTLLGDLLRPFSSDNFKTSLQEITDQLCEVLNGSLGSHDLEEGIVSCLLNIGGKFTFNRKKIVQSLFKWECKQDLRQTTKEKLNAFFKTHNNRWWRTFAQQHFPVTE